MLSTLILDSKTLNTGDASNSSEAADVGWCTVLEIVGECKLKSAIPALERRAFGWLRRWKRREASSWMALVSLARLGHPRARDEILQDLGAWSRDRRTMAVAAAGRAKLADATDLIQRMRGDERKADPHAVDEALGQLRASQP